MFEIVIAGAGSHARAVINLLDDLKYDIKCIYDDSYDPNIVENILNIPLLGKIDDIGEETSVVIAIGDNRKRSEFVKLLPIYNVNLQHHLAYCSRFSTLGKGNQIFQFSSIHSQVSIGDFNIINTSSIIEHEVTIGNFNHISIGAKIAGRSHLGNYCFIGAGATVIDKIKICNNVIIGANSLVVNDIVEPGTYVGNPVRKIK